MENFTEWIENAAAGVLFCLAVMILFLQLERMPEGIFPKEASTYEAVYVLGNGSGNQ